MGSDEEEEEDCSQICTMGKRFALMNEFGGENQVKDDIRNQVSAEVMNESETSRSETDSPGKSTQGAEPPERALTLEKHRLKKLEELEAATQSLKSRSNELVSTQDPFAGSYVILYVTSQLAFTHVTVRLGLRRISTPSFYNETLRLILSNVSLLLMAITDRSIFAVAKLITFMGLKMDGLDLPGFGLHQRYKSQFLKAVNVVREHFLPKLRAKKDAANLQTIITDITAYLDHDQMYLKEPVGRTMETDTLSSKITHEEDQHNQHYHGNYYRGYR
ncbi:hypothetical protein HID58_021341 [Brassica napus]|uniref:mRNA export factor GLE1 n=1 Tax=Brassica napus TaxID=3708 RepID=A0ABQ8CXP1_BRANA|nr:hypothetical protein HID58_021341 [Brassica napus]